VFACYQELDEAQALIFKTLTGFAELFSDGAGYLSKLLPDDVQPVVDQLIRCALGKPDVRWPSVVGDITVSDDQNNIDSVSLKFPFVWSEFLPALLPLQLRSRHLAEARIRHWPELSSMVSSRFLLSAMKFRNKVARLYRYARERIRNWQ
jgi:hypothetical protein